MAGDNNNSNATNQPHELNPPTSVGGSAGTDSSQTLSQPSQPSQAGSVRAPANQTASQPAQPRGQQPLFSQADLNRIVLEYLNKKGYHRTESMLRLESSNTPTPAVTPVSPATSLLASPGEIVSPANAARREKELKDKLNKNDREMRELKERQARVCLLYTSRCV